MRKSKSKKRTIGYPWRICSLDYTEQAIDAEKRIKRGEKQRYCEACRIWHWPDHKHYALGVPGFQMDYYAKINEAMAAGVAKYWTDKMEKTVLRLKKSR